jgi:hypothetical protein
MMHRNKHEKQQMKTSLLCMYTLYTHFEMKFVKYVICCKRVFASFGGNLDWEGWRGDINGSNTWYHLVWTTI